ncbi:fruit body specific hydrophobin [Pleurotus eryngii]|uniref:Hydrophobin n=1 Tax=Pleurotus eryngii TaxID=5323 RepID=A0A9P5ZQA1_PLEER|nr:fruit body specific hydrophobin [Pleurotus eryngii]
MFSIRISTVVLAASVILAVASPITNTESPVNQCNTGPIECCKTVQSASEAAHSGVLGVLDLFAGIQGLVASNCSPLEVVGVSGTSCSSQAVCCTGTSFNGLANVGCSPINLNL